jgi:hypothetical protein
MQLSALPKQKQEACSVSSQLEVLGVVRVQNWGGAAGILFLGGLRKKRGGASAVLELRASTHRPPPFSLLRRPFFCGEGPYLRMKKGHVLPVRLRGFRCGACFGIWLVLLLRLRRRNPGVFRY